MLQLPVEIRRLCLEALGDDGEALKATRLVNKELGVLATEILFRRAILNNTEDSAEKFRQLLGSTLNPHIHRLVINTSDDPEYTGGGREEAELSESFLEMLRVMHEVRNLEEVELKFAKECAVDVPHRFTNDAAETAHFRKELFENFLPALREAEHVRTLTIKNLQDHHEKSVFECEDFTVVRDRLTQLHLQIVSEWDHASGESSIDKPALHTGYTQDLPNIWLRPLNGQLTRLTLYGDSLWGIWPIVDFRTIPRFMHLKSLSLGNFTIAHNWQIDWIVSHNETLEELILDDCFIVTTLSVNEKPMKANFPDLPIHRRARWDTVYFTQVPMRWHEVLVRFRIELPQLQHFAMGHGDWEEGQAFDQRHELISEIADSRYAMYDWGRGPTQWIIGGESFHEKGYSVNGGTKEREYFEFPTCADEDRQALISLLECAEQRADARR
jgi:hypothetical protein